MEEPTNREDSGRNPDGTFKPGVSGNPEGRPKDTLKAFIARELREMNDGEKRAWLEKHKIPGEVMWKMGEGNPHSTADVEHDGVVTLKVIRFDGDIVSPQLDAGVTPTPSPTEQGEVQGGSVAPQSA